MKQVWIPYTEWEDYKAGMWRKCDKAEEQEMLSVSIEFTSNCELYGAAMLRVIDEWQNTCINSLTNKSINKKAFIGHCAVCLELGIPEYITRLAWKHLTDMQRIDANKKADYAIRLWNAKQRLKNTLVSGKKDATQMEYQIQLL